MLVRAGSTVQAMSTSSPESPEPDDLDRQWADITARLGPLQDPGAPGPRDYAAQEDDEGHFTPPDPGPVLPREPRNVLPWTGAVGGPMSLLVLLVFWPGAPPWTYFIGGAATVAGLITIWWRLPHRRDEGEGPNGAVV